MAVDPSDQLIVAPGIPLQSVCDSADGTSTAAHANPKLQLPDPDVLARHWAPVFDRIKEASPVAPESWQYLVTIDQVDKWMPEFEDLEKNYELIWVTVRVVPWCVPPLNFLAAAFTKAHERLSGLHAQICDCETQTCSHLITLVSAWFVARRTIQR